MMIHLIWMKDGMVGQYWLAVQTAGADNGFESDGRKTLGKGEATSPTLYNVTLVGLKQDGSTKDADDKNYGMLKGRI